MGNLHPPFNKDELKVLHNGIFKHSCKCIFELSNVFMMFNSNPNLRAREIRDLAARYHAKDNLIRGKCQQYQVIYDEVNKRTK